MRDFFSLDRKRTAYHEAGHAVMAHLCGQRVVSVEILGDEELSGSVSTLSLGTDSTSSPAMELRILCLLAGQVAESLCFSRVMDRHAKEDVDAAVRLALKLVSAPEEVMPYLENAEAEVARLLRREWEIVEELVAALLRNPVLEGEVLRQILARCPLGEEERAVS